MDISKCIDLKSTESNFGPIKNDNSRVIAICQKCNNTRESSLRSLKKSIKKTGRSYCFNCSLLSNDQFKRSKQLWENELFRKSVISSIKESWTDGRRVQQSHISKNLWINNEYIKTRKVSLEAIRNTEIYKQNHSLSMKKLWSNNDFIEKRSIVLHEYWTNENRIKQSNIMKRRWASYYGDNMRQKMSESEYRLLKSKLQSKIWNNDDYRKKQAISRSNILLSGLRSSLEIFTCNILSSLNISYSEQVPVGPYVFDFFLPDLDIYIECQGEYWHSLPKAISNDASKFTYLENSNPNSRILYLHERDFLNPLVVRNKILTFINDINYQPSVEFSFNDLLIRILDPKVKEDGSYNSLPKNFLNSFHYAQYGRSAKIVYGAFLGNELIAICKFSPVVRKEVATSLNLRTSEVLELDRFCIHPSYQKKNFASWFISQVSKTLTEKYKCLVSFADSTFGHHGIIYKAANWTEIGKVKKDYYYVNSDGWVLHKKTLYNHARSMKKSECEYAEENNYYKVYGKEKVKFIKML